MNVYFEGAWLFSTRPKSQVLPQQGLIELYTWKEQWCVFHFLTIFYNRTHHKDKYHINALWCSMEHILILCYKIFKLHEWHLISVKDITNLFLISSLFCVKWIILWGEGHVLLRARAFGSQDMRGAWVTGYRSLSHLTRVFWGEFSRLSEQFTFCMLRYLFWRNFNFNKTN